MHRGRVDVEDDEVAAAGTDALGGLAVGREVDVMAPAPVEAGGEDRLDVGAWCAVEEHCRRFGG